MSLGKTEQELKRDLEGLALDLKWSAVELKTIARALKGSGQPAQVQALQRMAEVFERGETRLALYASAVSDGRLGWVNTEQLPLEANLPS
jgi:hypothetical protein